MNRRTFAKTFELLPTALWAGLPLAAAEEPPTEWVDQATGHRIVRLSREPGTASLYFNQNAYTADGRKLIGTTPHGISTIDFETHEIQPVVESRVRVIVAGKKTGQVYYMKEGAIYATNVLTRAIQEIGKLPFRGSVVTVNADETLLAGTYVEGAPARRSAGAGSPQAVGADLTRPSAAQRKEGMLDRRFSQHLPMAMFTLDVKTGATKTFYRSHDWLNHLQFSPTDPALLLFCHEGPWHKVDRIWTIRTDGTGLTKIHTRTMQMEIAGHEFWSADGMTIWYDLQTPRGEDFWVAGYRIDNGERTWYHLQRDEWSVHFNVSPDGSLFAGDGGDEQMVAHAKNGKWIYLFRPRMVKDLGISFEAPGLIRSGVFDSERLVDMSRHN